MRKTTVHRKENELSVLSAASVVKINTSKYTSGLNQTSFDYSGGVQLDYSIKFFYLNSHISLNIHTMQPLYVPVYGSITADLQR